MTSYSPVFELMCDELESVTTLSKLEARGTIRLALKESGLEAAAVSRAEMAVVLERVLPRELEARGIKEPDLVGHLQRALEKLRDEDSDTTSAADVFRHLGGDHRAER